MWTTRNCFDRAVMADFRAFYRFREMRHTIRLVPIACAVFLLSGCAIPAAMKYRRSTDMTKISVGMTQQQVIATLGKPDAKEAAAGLECYQYMVSKKGYTYAGIETYINFDSAGRVNEFGEASCSATKLRELSKSQ